MKVIVNTLGTSLSASVTLNLMSEFKMAKPSGRATPLSVLKPEDEDMSVFNAMDLFVDNVNDRRLLCMSHHQDTRPSATARCVF